MIAGEDRVNDTIKFECMNSLAGYTDNGFRKMTSWYFHIQRLNTNV